MSLPVPPHFAGREDEYRRLHERAVAVTGQRRCACGVKNNCPDWNGWGTRASARSPLRCDCQVVSPRHFLAA